VVVRVAIGVGLGFVFLAFGLVGLAQPEKAPPNPAFECYLEDVCAGRPWPIVTSEGYYLGYVPPPVDLSHTMGRAPRAIPRLTLPSSYDLRGTGRLSPIRDQGACGSCWTFGTYAAVESWLLSHVPSVVRDYSENNLKECHGFDWGPCDGGNYWVSIAYFARGSGPVREAEDPYIDAPDPYGCSGAILACPNPDGQLAWESVARPVVDTYVREAWFISGVNKGTDPAPDYLKQAIMDYGAIGTSMRWESASYNPDAYAYCYTGEQTSTNHAVALVGWDDTFDRNRFPTTPAQDGAWIVRNSWGGDWGEDGYFYISYYDKFVATTNTVFIDLESPEGLSIYQYDPLGWCNEWRWVDDKVDWGANVFTADTGGVLIGVGFYTTDVEVEYEIDVRMDAPWGPSALAATVSGTCSWPGYHVVDLPEPLPISQGDRGAIVVKLRNPSYPYTMASEQSFDDYSSSATASPGQSYLSYDGSFDETHWQDLTGVESTSNFCIKGIFIDAPTPAVFRVTREGRVRADGAYWGSGFVTTSADIAEWVPVSEPVEPGDVLELDPTQPGYYRKARGPCSTLVAGVVSTQPGVALGSPPATHYLPPTDQQALLALLGVVPVKVTDENGPIRVGDLLVVSSTPGCVMRWDPEQRCEAGLLGKALETHELGRGAILVLLMR